MASRGKPHPLFHRTVHYVMLHMAQRSADDLAVLLILSPKTWMGLPPQTRKDFDLELIREHQFMLFERARRTSRVPSADSCRSKRRATTGRH